MGKSLAALVQERFVNDTELAKFRATLSEDDQQALDATLAELSQYKVSHYLASGLSPFERVLLLITIQQHQRIECLEVLLQRTSERILEVYRGR